jgi:hypothetical protein
MVVRENSQHKPKLVGIVFGLMIAMLLIVGFMWYLVSRQREKDVKTARDHKEVVEAIYNFRAARGWMPESLEDVVPEFLPKRPQSWRIELFCGLLSIPHDFPPGTNLVYTFLKEDEGWNVRGIPKLGPTRAELTGQELERARIKELDRRIAAKPNNLKYRTQKIAYLVIIGRDQDAVKECEAAATKAPHWWRAQYGMALLARREHAAAAEKRFREWVAAHPTFINYWYLAKYFRERKRPDDALTALREGAKHPVADANADAAWAVELFPYEAAIFSCQHREHRLTLEITRTWATYEQGSYANSPLDYLAFRAAANLGLGNLEAARSDAALAVEWSRTRFGKPYRIIYAGNLTELQQAIERGDRTYVYRPGPNADWAFGHWDWLWPRFWPYTQ